MTAHGAEQQPQEGEPQVEVSETDPNTPEGSEAKVEVEDVEVVQEQGEPAPESFEATDL